MQRIRDQCMAQRIGKKAIDDGDEVIDTLKAENDTSEWDNDEWVKQIWYYQNRKIINGMDPHTSLEDQLRSQYGNIHY